MPLLTKGSIGVTPILLKTSASLEELRKAALELKPVSSEVKPGWGSLGDSTDPIGEPNAAAPLAGSPAVVEEDEHLPARLELRAYWWSLDRSVMKLVGRDRKREAMRLMGADLLISPSASEEDEYLVLVSSRNQPEIRRDIKPLLSQLAESVDPSATVSLDTSPMDLVSEDFFLWLLYKTLEEEVISDETDTLMCREVRSVDQDVRETRLSQGVVLERPELLALICKENPSFGPIKLLIQHGDPELHLDCEVGLRGTYSIIKGGTALKATPEDLEPAYLNVLFALYYAHVVYPELVRRWNADTEWTQYKRHEFFAKCHEMLGKFSRQGEAG